MKLAKQISIVLWLIIIAIIYFALPKGSVSPYLWNIIDLFVIGVGASIVDGIRTKGRNSNQYLWDGRGEGAFARQHYLQIVIGGPAMEELVYRLPILLALSCWSEQIWWLAALSSLFFGLVHLNQAGKNDIFRVTIAILRAALIGLGLTWILLISHSIWVCVAAHAGFNLIIMILKWKFIQPQTD